jgi:ABC-type dipeptide/oligopeptide/nickel transport system permease subunit
VYRLPGACPEVQASTRQASMGSFLRENWVWIVAPIALVVVLVVAVVVIGGGDDSSFVYKIF